MRRTGLLVLVLILAASAQVSVAAGGRAQDRAAVRAAAPAASSAGDALQRASIARRRTELVSRDVAARLDEARHGRDLVRIHCLDGTLSEVGALLRMQDARISELRLALEARAGVRRERYHSMSMIWERRTRDLRRQADACVGEASPDTATTTVEATTDGPIPDVDVDLPAVAPSHDAAVLRLRA